MYMESNWGNSTASRYGSWWCPSQTRRSSCPTTGQATYMMVACIWWCLSCPSSAMVVPKLHALLIMDPMVTWWYCAWSPPLKRFMTGSIVAHLDALPLPAGSRRRQARKIQCDLQFLMNVVERMVWLNGRWTQRRIRLNLPPKCFESFNKMFQTVAIHFVLEGDATRHIWHGEHLKWPTFIPSFCCLHPQ